jgi:hypothetical protein
MESALTPMWLTYYTNVNCCSHTDVQFSFLISRTVRHGSLCQIEIDMSLKLSNYEDTVRQLDIYYGLGKLLMWQLLATLNIVSLLLRAELS